MQAKQPRPFTKRQERLLNLFVKPVSLANVWLYRRTGGRWGGRWLRGAPVLLLTTMGRKSGQLRTAPVLYLRDGNNVVVVASKAGMSHHPLWYRNLEANPDVKIQIGEEEQEMTARRATEEEKAALWPRLVQMYRDFDDYQARTERDIPVVILSPR